MRKVAVLYVVVLAVLGLVAPALAQDGTNEQVKRGLFHTFLGWTAVFTEAAKTQNGVDLILLIPRGAVKAAVSTAYGPVELVTSAIPEKPYLEEPTSGGEPDAQAARGVANTVLGWTEPFVEVANSRGGIDTVFALTRAPVKAVARTAYGVTELVTSPVPESHYLRPAGPVR
ncbi:hypothetical protein HY442_01800 [Candidatus Parcubacteria bacterium]|nr:hypothetical protein [Candidatus Parcubacteria bacterium]